MGKIIELIDISATYGEEIVLKDVNLTINSNDFIGIIGPNGGGKTTLVKLMVGLLKPVKGQIIKHKANGRDTKNQIGYLPQISRFDKRFPISVIDVVLSGLVSDKAVFKRYTQADKDKAVELLTRMGISNLYSRPIGELSGGQMQRVFLCRAIITSPSLLILDEPNTFVDSKFEADLYDILLELNKTMAIIVVTHDIGTISYYVKTIACVNKYLNYHPSNIITEKQLAAYGCPIQIITHGNTT